MRGCERVGDVSPLEEAGSIWQKEELDPVPCWGILKWEQPWQHGSRLVQLLASIAVSPSGFLAGMTIELGDSQLQKGEC